MTNSSNYSVTTGIRTSDLPHSMTTSKKVPRSYPLGHRGGLLIQWLATVNPTSIMLNIYMHKAKIKHPSFEPLNNVAINVSILQEIICGKTRSNHQFWLWQKGSYQCLVKIIVLSIHNLNLEYIFLSTDLLGLDWLLVCSGTRGLGKTCDNFIT